MPIRRDGQKLLHPNQIIEYTEQEVAELIKCKNDIYHFLKYVKIQHPVLGFINIDPYDFQLEFVDLMINNRFVIGMWSRQSGKSTIVAAYAMWFAIFHSHMTIAIVSNKEDSAKTILKRMKYIYQGLPVFLKPGVVEWAKTSVEFDNHTNIKCGSTTEDSLSGESCSLLICDEFAKVRPTIAKAFWSSNYPTIAVGGKCVVISTPKGIGNLFHQLWVKANREENDFSPYRVDYWQVPGRDKAWAEKERRNLGSREFDQEHGLKFLGSSLTLIKSDVLEKIAVSYKEPIELRDGENARFYNLPKEGHTYVLGIDVGQGLEQNESVIQAYDITHYPEQIEQVFTYSSNTISIYDFPAVVYKYGEFFNNAYLMVENNAEAHTVIKDLWFELEYENMVNVGKWDKTIGKKKFDLGIRSTPATKPAANLWFRKLVEDGVIILKDQNTIEQLCDYIEDNNQYHGENGLDDHVTASVWASYFFKTKFYDEIELEKRRKIHKIDNVEIEKKKEDDMDDETKYDVWGFDQNDFCLDDIEKTRQDFQRELMKP